MRLILIRVIAALQIVGASAAAAIMLPTALSSWSSPLSAAVFLVMYCFFVLAFFSGMWLWDFESRGFRTAVIVQALQIPVIQTAFVTYKFAFGIGLTFLFIGPGPTIRFDAGSQSYLVLLSEVANTAFGVNLVAVIALIFLIWQARVILDSSGARPGTAME